MVRGALLVIVSLFMAVYVLLPVGFGAYATLRHDDTPVAPPPGFSDVVLTASDGVPLAAWYASSRNGAAIVLVHPATGSRHSVKSYAQMLHNNGFGVLALDLRGHGASGGKGNSFAWEGTRDVEAAVGYLRQTDDHLAIGGMGISLGGEVLLGAAADLSDVKAIVSDGATHRSISDYTIFPSQRGLVQSWTVRLMYMSVRLFSGEDPPMAMLSSVQRANKTRFLFIAAGDEPNEGRYNRRFYAAAPNRSELWVVPGVGHTQGYARHRAEYMARVVGFLKSRLVPSLASVPSVTEEVAAYRPAKP